MTRFLSEIVTYLHFVSQMPQLINIAKVILMKSYYIEKIFNFS